MPELTEEQKFLQWQHKELCDRIDRAYSESENEPLIEAMLAEKERMEDEYDNKFGIRPPPSPPPPPPWW